MRLTLALLASLTLSAARAQSPAAPAFVLADVHPSPHTTYPFARNTTRGDLFTMRQANMVDLIGLAYGVDTGNVAGGPRWMETNHFDIYAKIPPHTPPEDVKLMLRKLLAERFSLVLHAGTKPLPAFVLTVDKGAPKMTQSDGSADPACVYVDPPANPPPSAVGLITFSCHNTSMAILAQNLHAWGGSYLTSPVADQTGLKGGWDFDLKWTNKGQLAKAGADGTSIFDAVDKQLGLKLEAKTAPLPVVAVDSVNEAPTPNVPDLAKILPPPPAPEFDVATIRVSPPDVKLNGRVSGAQVSLTGGTMQFMLAFAFDVSNEMLVNAPRWIETDHFDINAKAATDNTPGAPQMDPDDLRAMMRKFLTERFNLKVHMEDRPLEAYTLVAAGPKLKKADPSNRTSCKEGPGDDGKDPRIANPILGRLLTCRNMTVAQFAEQMQTQANGYIHTPVLDSTGIEGTYDFTVSFSTADQARSAAAPGPDGASDPNGAISFLDAVNKQLGLKLVKGKRPVPSLVIDHIDEKPTEN